MADIVDRRTRSRMMSGIKGKNTKPERVVRSYLHRSGLRFRLHDRSLPGSPDLVFRQHNTIVQVHGCYWHQHPGCRFAYSPKSNAKFWREKLSGNVIRDRKNAAKLRRLGWRVLTVWECQVHRHEVLERLANRIRSVNGA
ncbi:MAG: very short patch repair endonuclease [Thermoanaerobaculia bacterium]